MESACRMLATARRIPRAVWVLGLVSLFMDMSSELVHAVLPVYLTAVLGLSVFAVGVIEGIAQATASMVKIVSGYLSDHFARRKPLTVLGYALAALTKPVFPLADGATAIVTARFIDRVGKGIRGAPRDALVADVTPHELRDAAYGLRQAMDTLGAVIGPLLALVFLLLWANDLRAVLWVAAVPAVIAVVLLAVGLDEPPAAVPRKARPPLKLSALGELPVGFWAVVGLMALFTLARLSEAFLVLKAQDEGLGLAWIPLVMVVMSVVYAASAYPAGVLSARFGRLRLWTLALVALCAAELSLAWLPGGFWPGVALWGLHMGLSQGVLAAAVAHLAPPALRATAFGVFHFVTGLGQLACGALAGWLWLAYGPAATFTLGALSALGTLLLVCLPAMRRVLSPPPEPSPAS